MKVGDRFGRLVVLRIPSAKAVECACDCGGNKTAWAHNLRAGRTRSCGCVLRESARTNGRTTRTHGHATHRTPEYYVWNGMLARCTNPRAPNFKYYGGRGITVCDRWRAFAHFLADMGSRPQGSTLDRVDNDRGYEPGNCRWATPREQARNRSTTRMVSIGGVTKCVTEWASIVGVTSTCIRERLRRGWSAADLLLPPCRAGQRHAGKVGT